MGETAEWRRDIPAAQRFGIGLIGDVENEHASIYVAEVAAVGALRIDVGVVRAETHVEARRSVADRRRSRVAHPGARHPPAADLNGLGWLAHIEGAIELVIK